MFKNVSLTFVLMLCLLVMACGEPSPEVAAVSSIKAYYDQQLKIAKSEVLKATLKDKRDFVISRARIKFERVEEIQDLSVQDRVKQAVIMALNETLGPDWPEN